jgi:hypothetical protein
LRKCKAGTLHPRMTPSPKPGPYSSGSGNDPIHWTGLIGALRDDAELLDQAVEHAMKVREERPWRLAAGE